MTRPTPGRGEHGSGIRFSAWNALLLLPLLMLVTAFFNRDSPRLLGLPFFYWFQFAFVFVGVACVAAVYAMTRHLRGSPGASPTPPVNPDEGDRRPARPSRPSNPRVVKARPGRRVR